MTIRRAPRVAQSAHAHPVTSAVAVAPRGVLRSDTRTVV